MTKDDYQKIMQDATAQFKQQCRDRKQSITKLGEMFDVSVKSLARELSFYHWIDNIELNEKEIKEHIDEKIKSIKPEMFDVWLV